MRMAYTVTIFACLSLHRCVMLKYNPFMVLVVAFLKHPSIRLISKLIVICNPALIAYHTDAIFSYQMLNQATACNQAFVIIN